MKLVSMLCLGVLLTTIGGCGLTGAPLCTDSEVKGLVIKITNEELVSQLFKIELRNKAGAYPASVLARISVDTWKNNPPEPKSVASNFTFDVKDIHGIISAVEAQVSELRPELSGIRVVAREDTYKKVSCSAQIVFQNGKELPITYTAQLTEDDDVYVEVQDL